MQLLAIKGGKPVIDKSFIVNRNQFTEKDKQAIYEYLNHDNVLSFYGDEGIQREYETSLMQYFEAKHCILVNSGTDALFSAYFALGLEPGDEMIVPAFSFFAIASPLLLFHVKIVIADCEPDTGLISIDDVLDKVTERTKGVVINHVCGDSVEMDVLVKELKNRGIPLIEDLSLAFGAMHNGRKLGTYGDMVCCSLGSTKMLSGGQGGFVITNNREYYERIIMLGCFGQRAKQNVYNPFYRQFVNVSYGLNIRMHSLAIAVSLARFKQRDLLIQSRRIRYEMLSNCITQYRDILEPPRKLSNKDRGSWHGYYAIFSDNVNKSQRSIITKALQAEGLLVNQFAHYPLINKEKLYWCEQDGIFRLKRNPYKIGCISYECPQASIYNQRILSFPLFLDEPIECVRKYCDGLDKVFANIRELY